MKRIGIILSVAALVCLLAVGVSAKSVTQSGTCGDSLTWTLYDDGALVISGTGEMDDYSYIYKGGKNITTAPWRNYASDILSVTIENGVTSIGGDAFSGCTALSSVTIGDSVISICWRAFEDCTALTSVTIPSGVTSIGDDAFYNCKSLESITVDGGNTEYKDINGVLFNKAGTTLIQYPTGRTDKEYTIPSSVTSIGNAAFYNSTDLASVTIGGSVTSIGWNAFEGCTALASVTIGDGITSVGNAAFYNTAWYNNQPDGLVYAGKVAYKYKGDMPDNTEIVIKDGTKSVGNFAFCECMGLTSVTIPDSVTSIGWGAFQNCTALASVNIGRSVKKTGEYAFAYCCKLSDIQYNGTEQRWDALTKGISWDYQTGSDVDGYTVHFLGVEDTLYGDVNNDGKITALDNAYLARYLAKWSGYDDTNVDLAAADVNDDGKVTALDNAVLARYLAKWSGYDELPHTNG